ncbi:LamG domain-containing protein [Streptomyces sp. NPDC088354]|uniref:LamG domain-containing protein n=1 Tax=Streptomyces sp. NPDC088354 TaxID=3365856 RepID=UPI003819361F
MGDRARARRLVPVIGLATSAVLLTGLLPTAVAYAAPAAAKPTTVQDESSTSATAAETGERVEVIGLRDEYAQTFANPDGTFTLEQATVPQRVKAADGTWLDPDATLERRADGRIAPKAAVVDVSFSGGGAGEGMLRIAEGGKSLSLGWPGVLPQPVLSGATATYPEVLPGVDLQMTATVEGYREVLVVKSAQAAANPDLEHIQLQAQGSGLELAPGAGGGVRAVDDDGNAVFKGAAAVMWDSAGSDPTASSSGRTESLVGQRQLLSADDGQTDDGLETQPGDGDTTAVLPVQLTDGAVSVRPDLGLLRGEATVYPVRIDPAVGLGASERTVLSSDGDTFWQFNGDYGVGNCSAVGPYYCGSNYTNRMYYEFSPARLSGKYVLDATFRVTEKWSFDCNPHWVDLERTNNISEGTKWPGPAPLDLMGDRNVSAGRGDLCSPSQPDAKIEFNDNPDEPDENLASTVRSLADGKISRLTLMLRAKDEEDPSAWKRFDDNGELSVTYIAQPGTPTDVGLIPGDGTTAYCRTSAADPLMVTRTDPLVQARVQTKVQPASGEDKGNLQAEFVVERQADNTWASSWSGYRPSSGWVDDGILQSMRTTDRADNTLYRYRARTQSHTTFSGKAVDQFSSYSSWCYFKVDVTAPNPPRIVAKGPYTQCTANLCQGAGGPGVAGKFDFLPNTADQDITGYRYRLLTTTAADKQEVTADANHNALGVSVPPVLAGTEVLSVEAKDVRQRWGAPSEFMFKVAPAAGAVGRWHFDDYPAGSTEKTAKDSAVDGTVRHDATMYTAGTGFSSLARRGDADQSLWMDSTDPAHQQGYATTDAAAVNTGDSFTISTWVYLTDASTNRVVLAEPGTHTYAFALYYSASYKAWVFNRTDQDKTDPVFLRSIAETQNPPLNVWTHLAAVFKTEGDDGIPDTDPSNDTIQLFVNGRPQGQPVNLKGLSSTYQPWTASGGLQWGRTVTEGVGSTFFRGRIDESAVWQRALTENEIREEAAVRENGVPQTEMVAAWDATTSSGSTVKESSPYPWPALALASTGAVIDTDNNELTLNGTSGYAQAAGPVLDETGSFTVTARAQLNSVQWASKPTGYTAIVAAQRAAGTAGESSWALWAEKRADGVYWCFGRAAVDAAGKLTKSGHVEDWNIAELDTWVQVTGIFDANEVDATQADTQYGVAHLYVGESEQPLGTDAGFDAVQQGSGDITAGAGSKGGASGNYLPGALEEIRVFVGAMDYDQVMTKIIAPYENQPS